MLTPRLGERVALTSSATTCRSSWISGPLVRPLPGDGADLRPALEPRARFAKVNVDEEPAIAGDYRIRGIPTLIVFDHGKVAKQHAGLVDINFLRGLAR